MRTCAWYYLLLKQSIVKKVFYFIITLLVSNVSVSAQTLSGSVTDAFTQKPISNVLITSDKGGAPISTDSLGKFELPCEGTPLYLTAHIIGYHDEQVKVSNCTRSVRIELKPSSVQLNEVQINEWNTNESKNNQLEEAKSIGVLTADDLHRDNGLSLQTSIDLIPGVDMESRTPWGGQRIIIRGYYGGGSNGTGMPNFEFNGNGFQLYLNNIPITDAFGSTIMDAIDFSQLGKVEVIKGPQSSIFGSGIGGVVNLYTVRPAPFTTQISQQLIGGSNGLIRSNTTIATAGSNYDMLVNYGHQQYSGFRANDWSHKDYASFSGNYYSGDRNTLSGYFQYSKSYEQLAGEMDSAELYSHSATGVSSAAYAANNSHVAIESMLGGITDNFKFNKYFSWQTTLSLASYTSDQPFAHGYTEATALSFSGRTALAFEKKVKKVGIHGIVGASVRKTNQLSDGIFIVPIPIPNPPIIPSYSKSYGTTANVYTEWNITLPLQFAIKAGASVNFNQFNTQSLTPQDSGNTVHMNPNYARVFPVVMTPNISLIKVFKDVASVYANVGFGYTPPTVSNVITSIGTVDSVLKPERAIQYEIGTKGSFISKKLSYQLALFYMDIYNKLETETGNIGGASYTYTANIGEERNLGVELALSYAIISDKNKVVSLLRPFITYTYSDFRYHNFTSNVKGDTANYNGNKVAGVAPNRLNAGLDFELKYGIYLNATYQFFDKMPYTFDNQHYLKSYNLLGAKIGYHHEFIKHLGVDVFVGVDNILSATYASFAFIGENLGQISGDGYLIPANWKPTIYGGGALSWKF
jgi:iron complex outermembrane receptor protein